MPTDVSKKLSKALADIRNTFISATDYSPIDNAIDKSIAKLTISDLNSNTLNYSETMKKYMTQNIDTSSITKDITTNILQSPDVIARFSRYSNAEEVIYNISQCARALKVLSSGILSPDNITKSSLNILVADKSDSEETKEILNNLKIINKELKIEDYLDNIITETLKYGDKFLEFCSYKSEEVPLTQSLYLEEQALYEVGKANKPVEQEMPTHKIVYEEYDFRKMDDNGNPGIKKITKNLKLNLVEYVDKDKKTFSLNEKANKKKENIFQNIEELRIIQHDPTHIVKLQSDRFKVCLGYLVLPDGFGGDGGSGLGMMSASGIMQGGSAGAQIASGLANDLYMGVDALYIDLVKLIKRHVNNSDLKVNKKEMKDLLARLVKDLDNDSNSKEVKIRYVPPERMEHFHINERINFPYGEGVFEKTMHSAKELIAIKTAITVRRITDSVDKRVIYIETNMPRNSRNMITLLREALRKRKFSMNNLSNISSIPSMMTNFEDYIITSKNGKRHVEFDTIPTTSRISDITEELKFFRDELVSSLDVPPAFIGIEENINGKSTLAHESALFAETILSYQKVFNRHIFKMFNSIHKLLYNENIPDCITITLPPPKMLYISVEAEHFDTVARLLELSNTLGVDRETLKKRYLPLDWEQEEDAKVKTLLDKRGNPTEKGEDDGLMGGGYGGMAGMGMGAGMPVSGGIV
jgi:hypothetical protein